MTASTDRAMIDAFKELVSHQFEAALCTLSICIDKCPDAAWNAPVANYKFCQVAFHTVFYADYYLGTNDPSFREQPFHREHADFFRDYEEFIDRPPVLLYDRPTMQEYVEHCRQKAAKSLPAETPASLAAPCGFPRKSFSRAELHVYSIRHIQHHAAQLSLRLRLDHKIDIPWVRTGWDDRKPSPAIA
jgi:hypothetical protein